MCGKNSIACSNCISTWIPKCSNLALPSPVASHQAPKCVFSEYPYVNPYEKVDHESTNTVNDVEEVPRPLFYNKELAFVIPHNYSGYKSDTVHGGSPPSLQGMSPNEYRSPCSTPEIG